jgi:hypothetical protein
MNRILSFSGIVLLLPLVTGCTSTLRINQFERFADAGKSYTDIRRLTLQQLRGAKEAMFSLEGLLANEDALNKSAAALAKALENLNKVKEVIGAASAFLGVVGKIVKLL